MDGYFEETNISAIHPWGRTTVRLTDYGALLQGHLTGIAHGITVANAMRGQSGSRLREPDPLGWRSECLLHAFSCHSPRLGEFLRCRRACQQFAGLRDPFGRPALVQTASLAPSLIRVPCGNLLNWCCSAKLILTSTVDRRVAYDDFDKLYEFCYRLLMRAFSAHMINDVHR